MSKHVLNTRLRRLPRTGGGDVRRLSGARFIRLLSVPVDEPRAGGEALKSSLIEEGIVWCSDQQVWFPSADTDQQIELLYKAHSGRLLRRFARSAAHEEAKDLVQETFHRLLRAGSQRLQSLHRAEAYLSSIATNLLRDRARAERRHGADAHEPLDEERLEGPNQQHLLEQRDLLNRLDQAMLRLKPKTREIFMAHRLEGLSYAEIAERTGLSVKGVEKHMCKAIAQLDRALHRS